jgi:hypothetical protein
MLLATKNALKAMLFMTCLALSAWRPAIGVY